VAGLIIAPSNISSNTSYENEVFTPAEVAKIR
jgi:hypothetical protein